MNEARKEMRTCPHCKRVGYGQCLDCEVSALSPGEAVARMEAQAWMRAQNEGMELLAKKCVRLAAHMLAIATAEFENNIASMPVAHWFDGWSDWEKEQFVAWVNCTQPKLGDDLPVTASQVDTLPDYWVMETVSQVLKGISNV